jgi:hypothetical protein
VGLALAAFLEVRSERTWSDLLSVSAISRAEHQRLCSPQGVGAKPLTKRPISVSVGFCDPGGWSGGWDQREFIRGSRPVDPV